MNHAVQINLHRALKWPPQLCRLSKFTRIWRIGKNYPIVFVYVCADTRSLSPFLALAVCPLYIQFIPIGVKYSS